MFFDVNLYLIASFAIAVFAILNPFSTIPYYMLLHPNASRKDVKMDTKIIALASFAILLFSMLVGKYVLGFFGLEIEYFKIAGGVLLIIMSVSMMQGKIGKIKYDETDEQNITERYLQRGLIVPLAMPITSGPGSIAYVISHSVAHNAIELFAGITIASLFVYIVLRSAIQIKAVLGDLGIKVVTRFIGIILLSLGIQIVLQNIILVFKINFPGV
ncbi:MAG: MarC family protein [Candidatus Gracilibacteria bacterium]|nr:MarC family protein [Candidatus Gracilibacteria bacterium]